LENVLINVLNFAVFGVLENCVEWQCCVYHTVYYGVSQEHTKEELDAWKLVRVHEDFRVIALGLPVPRYQGNPLDPPLRSRFQARHVQPVPFKVPALHTFLCAVIHFHT